MGCCCCCIRPHKERREIDPESRAQPPFGPPPSYKESESNTYDHQVTPTTQAEKPILSTNTRLGVRSKDHSLYQAAAGGHLDEVKELLESGFNPSTRTVCDWCPLHWAANNDIEHGLEIVRLLVRYGADVNQVSDT
ncbi:putative ankyrin repeat protein, partial [Lachnellula suecica]